MQEMNADNNGNENEQTQTFFVIAKVAGNDYLTKVESTSMAGAEHRVLDLGMEVRHRFTVEASQAFGREEAKTFCFVDMAMASTPVTFFELAGIIKRVNEKARAEVEVEEAQKDIERLMRELNEVRARRDEALRVINGVA